MTGEPFLILLVEDNGAEALVFTRREGMYAGSAVPDLAVLDLNLLGRSQSCASQLASGRVTSSNHQFVSFSARACRYATTGCGIVHSEARRSGELSPDWHGAKDQIGMALKKCCLRAGAWRHHNLSRLNEIPTRLAIAL